MIPRLHGSTPRRLPVLDDTAAQEPVVNDTLCIMHSGLCIVDCVFVDRDHRVGRAVDQRVESVHTIECRQSDDGVRPSRRSTPTLNASFQRYTQNREPSVCVHMAANTREGQDRTRR